MARPLIEGTQDQWERVASAVRTRRESIPLTHRQAVDAVKAGSISTWSAIERAERPGYTRATLTTICNALGWREDSIDRIMAGGEPIVVEASDLSRRVAALEAQLEEVLEVLEELRDNQP